MIRLYIITTKESIMKSIIKSNNHNSYSGLLNSNYQNIVNFNFKVKKSNSIFGLKQRLKSDQFKTCCSIDTGLKLVVFFTGIIIALS